MDLTNSDVGGHHGRVLYNPNHGLLGHLAFALRGGHLLLRVRPAGSTAGTSNSSAIWVAQHRRHMLCIVIQLAILRRGMARVGLGWCFLHG
jgi:hypothetical protein